MSSMQGRRELWQREKRATRAKAKKLGLPLQRSAIKKRRPCTRLDKALAIYWPDWIARA